MALASAINVHVANSAATNRTNLQAAINAGDCSIQFDETGQYLFDRTIVIDTAYACTLDGMGTGNLHMDDSATLGGGLIEWVTNTTSTGPQRVLNFKQLSSAGDKILGTRRNGSNGRVCFTDMVVEKSYFPAYEDGWCIDWDLDTALRPVIRDCHFQGANNGGGGIHIYGAAHSCSALEISNCRLQFKYLKLGPNIWLYGVRMLHLRNTISEGDWGFSPNVTVSDFEGANGLFLDNPGPQTNTIFGLWNEFWGSQPQGQYDVVIRNPWTGSSAGSNSPGVVHTVGINAMRTKIINANDADPLVVDFLAPADRSLVQSANLSGDLIHVFNHHGMSSLYPCGDINGIADPRVSWDYLHQAGRNFGMGLFSAPGVVLYRFPGGNGNDGAMTPHSLTRGTVYAHRHPVYGSCMAVYYANAGAGGIYGHAYERLAGTDIPDISGKRFYKVVSACMPHRNLQGGGTTGSCLVGLLGQGQYDYRSYPDGFSPGIVQWSVKSQDASWCWDFEDMAPVAGDNWLLVYAATCAAGQWAPLEPLGTRPATFYVPDSTAPVGTFGVGDRYKRQDTGDVKTCSAAGTSRTISVNGTAVSGGAVVTCSTQADFTKLLEGDYIKLNGAAKGYIKTMAPGTLQITLNSNHGLGNVAVTITNSTPTWV